MRIRARKNSYEKAFLNANFAPTVLFIFCNLLKINILLIFTFYFETLIRIISS